MYFSLYPIKSEGKIGIKFACCRVSLLFSLLLSLLLFNTSVSRMGFQMWRAE